MSPSLAAIVLRTSDRGKTQCGRSLAPALIRPQPGLRAADEKKRAAYFELLAAVEDGDSGVVGLAIGRVEHRATSTGALASVFQPAQYGESPRHECGGFLAASQSGGWRLRTEDLPRSPRHNWRGERSTGGDLQLPAAYLSVK